MGKSQERRRRRRELERVRASDSPIEAKDNGGDTSPDTPTEKDEEKQGHGINKYDLAVAFVEAVVGGGGFAALGEYFDKIGLHRLQDWCVLLALVAVEFALAHLIFKILAKRKAVWLILGLVAVLEGAVFAPVLFGKEKDKPGEPKPVVTRPDFIEGTDTTHKFLEQHYPFGYAVIWPKENQRFRFEVFKTGTVEWGINLDEAKFETDFAAGMVHVFLPNTTANTPGTADFTLVHAILATRVPLKKGVEGRVGVYMHNAPVPHFMVLADNQRSPIFAVGFRIAKETERKLPPGRKAP